MPVGNGPQFTTPLFCSDEHVAIHARGDYYPLATKWETLAEGVDGSFAPNVPWVLTSASVPFQQQGVAAQSIVVLSEPKGNFPGGVHLFAVDSVSGFSVTLRRVGLPLGSGHPPAPAAGLSGVKFSVPTMAPQIDEVSYRLKDRFAIDEAIFWRGSSWMYQGAEDLYRCLRDACVFAVLADAYEVEARDQTESGDFARKARLFRRRESEADARVQIRWGPFGNSQQPTGPLNTRLSR